MAKAAWCGEEIYDTAIKFRDTCLIEDGSLFTSGEHLWTGTRLDALGSIVDTDPGQGTFIDKVLLQLQHRSDQEIQLVGEALAVLLTWVHDTNGDLRRKHVDRVLAQMQVPVVVPAEIDAAFHAGGVSSFSAANAWRHAQVRFLLRFGARVKRLSVPERHEVLADLARTRALVHEVRTSNAVLAANALLHVLFPERVEYVISETHRNWLIEAFANVPGIADEGDQDDKIARIRAHVQSDQPNPVDLYEPPVFTVWAHEETLQWSEATRLGGLLFDRPSFDEDERTYKLTIGAALAGARTAFLADVDEWPKMLKAAIGHSKNNLTNWQTTQPFTDWIVASPDEARTALAGIWTETDVSVEERLEAFLTSLPKRVVSGGGTRISIASLLLLAVDPCWLPFFKPTPVAAMRKALGIEDDASAVAPEPESLTRPEEIATRLGIDGKRVRDFLRATYPRDDERWGTSWHLTPDQVSAVLKHFGDVDPSTDDPASQVARYMEWIELLQELRVRLLAAGHAVRDLLDAQGVAWWLMGPIPSDWSDADKQAVERFRRGALGERTDGIVDDTGSPGGGPGIPRISPELAAELHLPLPFLSSVADLLNQTRQVILYGPPGTGKTFLATRLAAHVEAAGGSSRLVQFHPSYTYEDFFEGFRPRATSDGTLHFKLVPGALREIAQVANDQPEVPHLLVIDEINRGNIPKIFGELYFLLEYRDQEIRLQYSNDDLFSLPSNLYVIGTMNTADKSIALVDAALRRRFGFVGLMPTKAPVDAVLTSWLAAHDLDPEPAALLAALNDEIADADFSIGPSYFMTKDGTAPRLERIWQYSIMPLLEEHYYGHQQDLDARFGLAALRARVTAATERITTLDDPDSPAEE